MLEDVATGDTLSYIMTMIVMTSHGCKPGMSKRTGKHEGEFMDDASIYCDCYFTPTCHYMSIHTEATGYQLAFGAHLTMIWKCV